VRITCTAGPVKLCRGDTTGHHSHRNARLFLTSENAVLKPGKTTATEKTSLLV
jgi:hypothetical protein